MNDNVSIEWESTGYSVLKNLNATVLGIFCEFIDNSIQSYREKKELLKAINPDYKLRIVIDYDGNEISIEDNAGGIDKKNFERALKPANRPNNTEGLNEFGLGMKYAAVWISNEWELISTAIGEDKERRVLFDYNKVIKNNLKELPFQKKQADPNEHYTKVLLRKLEKKHVDPWQRKYLIKHLKSIYRNFIRGGNDFYNDFKEDDIELILFQENHSNWEEYGFLNKPFWKDLKVNNIDDPKDYEWKFKFPWTDIPYTEEVLVNDKVIKKESSIRVCGFVGILPDGDHKEKNGFVLFRRGRVVEGYDQRIYPIDISGRSARDFKHIRLYGELHFQNVEISFDKTKLSINREKRDDIFSVIANMLKKVDYGGREFNLLNQASEHRVNTSTKSTKKAIENYKEKAKKVKTEAYVIKEEKVANEIYDLRFEEQINDKSKDETGIFPEVPPSKVPIGENEYNLELIFNKGKEKLYSLEEINDSYDIKINVNVNHPLFSRNNDFNKEPVFSTLIEIIKCLGVSEIKAKLSGGEPKHFRFAFNRYLDVFLNDLR
ncbi:ATP-binding protein [Flavobacteriaceae bacterium]|nr:ATP-binding protein [Flavobacteriaceae bacterium]